MGLVLDRSNLVIVWSPCSFRAPYPSNISPWQSQGGCWHETSIYSTSDGLLPGLTHWLLNPWTWTFLILTVIFWSSSFLFFFILNASFLWFFGFLVHWHLIVQRRNACMPRFIRTTVIIIIITVVVVVVVVVGDFNVHVNDTGNAEARRFLACLTSYNNQHAWCSMSPSQRTCIATHWTCWSRNPRTPSWPMSAESSLLRYLGPNCCVWLTATEASTAQQTCL